MLNHPAQARAALEAARAACLDAIAGIDKALVRVDLAEKFLVSNPRMRTREMVIKYLAANEGPRGAKEIYDTLAACGAAISEEAIYKTLSRLVEQGEIRRVTQGVYEGVGQQVQPSTDVKEQPPFPTRGQRWVDKTNPEREVVLLRWCSGYSAFRCAVYINKLIQKEKVLISINLFGSHPTGYTYAGEGAPA